MDPRTLFATRVLDRYRKLPGTLHRTLRQDRNLALRLYDRGVPLQKIEDAFLLALARRTFRSSSEPIEPIRSLHYFLPLIQELEVEPPLPEYLAYLKDKLVRAGAWYSRTAQLHYVRPQTCGSQSGKPAPGRPESP
jgi:hypothetical protein